MTLQWNRRQFIGSLAATCLAPECLAASADQLTVSDQPARCSILDAKGNPVPAADMQRFYVCDLLSRPFPIEPEIADGTVSFIPPVQPFRISLPLTVPGFGQVFLYSDALGKGHTKQSLNRSAPLNLNQEFAADRLATVRHLSDECRRTGIILSAEALQRIADAERLFEKCKAPGNAREATARWAMESLRESLWAGEMLAFERARHRVSRQGPRPGFLFGCNAFGYADYGKPYAERFEALFNFATLPFYRNPVERVEGKRDYGRVDKLLSWLGQTGVVLKGHPLIFPIGGVTPSWLRNRPFAEAKSKHLDYVRDTILKYRSHIHVWDVINEAHVQPEVGTGVQGFTREDNVELTKAALETARLADPTCYRIVNSTGTWGDYYLGRKPAPWQQSVYDYLKMLQVARCDYEAVGLQYYHSGRDLLELERDISRFEEFGKPIHLSELGFASSSEEIPGDGWWGGGQGGARLLWHGERFTEKAQADWVEQVYTIAYSKPYIQALTWWDLSDPAFVPHGGLVNRDMTPKESYHRLSALRAKWQRAE